MLKPGTLVYIKNAYNVYDDISGTIRLRHVVSAVSCEFVIIIEKTQDIGHILASLAWYKVITRNGIVGYIMMHSSAFDET